LNNVAGAVEIPLTTFGGENTELDPTDLPQGLSPAAPDVAFAPGRVFTRPSLQRLDTLGSNSQIVYGSSFTQRNGTVSQMRFDSLGGMYADGVKIGQTAPGNRFHTASVFGKIYIAISDGLHGADVPLQWDGTNLDRVSQDGPGAGPTIANFVVAPVALAAGVTAAPVPLSYCNPINPVPVRVSDGSPSGYYGTPGYGSSYSPPTYVTYYTSIQYTTASAHGLTPGNAFAVAGDSRYNSAASTVLTVIDALNFTASFYGQDNSTGIGGTVTSQAPALARSAQIVTANTATAHGLRAGYKFTIANISALVESILSVVIDTDAQPGVATVTTSQTHGLVPGTVIQITGVGTAPVGGSLTNYVIDSHGSISVTTSSPHRLVAGETIVLALGSGTPTAVVVSAVLGANSFSVITGLGAASGSSGSITLPFALTTNYTVATVLTPTSFQVASTFFTGSWSGGLVSIPWAGTFYVSSVISSTSFTYSQNGPDAAIANTSASITPVGQVAPGQRKCVVVFQTRSGYVTQPGPAVKFTASGGQYVFLTNIPIGPPNVVARILAFTGANGGEYYYLPVDPQLNGGLVGTSTVIADNTSTSAILDFSDQSLYAGIDIGPKYAAGNNLFNQEVLGPCLGFYPYASRLFAWGERNKVQNFLNMGFEGGILPFTGSIFIWSGTIPTSNAPLGWNSTGTSYLTPIADYGLGWQPSGSASISQSAYLDQYGVPILQPNVQYTFRCWARGPFIATLSSASTGFVVVASVTGAGTFGSTDFTGKTPLTIPPDLLLTITGAGVVDEVEIIYTVNPYRSAARASYVNNPEAFDGVTGIIGPALDPQPIMGMEERRDVLSILTFGPNGSLYESENSSSGEPASWSLRHVASKCGLISVWAKTAFEDWFIWASDTGIRIYDGGGVDKISQEQQTWWDSIAPGYRQLTFIANDPLTRRFYIGAVTGTATAVNSFYAVDYRELNSAGALSSSGPVHVSNYSGKVITTDLTRKWSPWSLSMNFCGMVTLASGGSVMAFYGGIGGSLSNAGYSATYTLVEGQQTGVDADYGAFWQNSYYTTYFYISPEDAMQKQLGMHRLLHTFLTMNITGTGAVFVAPHLDRIGNFGRTSRAVAVNTTLPRDLEFGLNLSAERIAYRVGCQPIAGVVPSAVAPSPTAQAGFVLSEMVVAVKTNPFSPIRGKNG
jgi:hypothetical protein